MRVLVVVGFSCISGVGRCIVVGVSRCGCMLCNESVVWVLG